MSSEYLIDIPGLADMVAAVPVDPADTKHQALLRALRAVPALETVEYATSRDGFSLVQHKVFDAGGALVHDDHRAWLAQEYVNDGARAGVTHQRLRAAGLRLAETEITKLYLVVDRGGAEENFLQLEVEVLVDRMSNQLMGAWGLAPRDMRELVEEARGPMLPLEEQVVVGKPHFQLHRVIDMARFLGVIDAAEGLDREKARAMRFTVTDSTPNADPKPPERVVNYAELDPEFDKYPAKGRRLFKDWAASSAGKSGQRLCRHWVMDFSDAQDKASNERWVSLVPMWTYGKKLARIESRKGSTHALYDKLLSIDRRTGAPFAWFFYMLHGNRVREGAAYRVLEAAEAGQLELPDRDYQVLRRWKDREYGF